MQPPGKNLVTRQPLVFLVVLTLLLFLAPFLAAHYLQPIPRIPLFTTKLSRFPSIYLSPASIDELHSQLAPALSKPRHRTMVLSEAAKKVATEFLIPDEQVQKIVSEFISQLKEGLEKNATTMSQIPTYVTSVPNGTEKGLFLAVDLGGTNFRVCSIQLNGDSTFNLIQSKVPIPKDLMVAKTAKELFYFLAKQIELFLKDHHEEHFAAYTQRRQTLSTLQGYREVHIFRLGFTFSFPIHQTGINKGTLMRWTKGFDIPDAIGQDVCALLQHEIDLLGLPVKVAALVNDTVGTLMARSYTAPGKTKTLLGAIFGTGTNGAYMENLSAITKPLEGHVDRSTGEMVINTEWGSFDNHLKVLPTTIYDAILDRESVNPGLQMFEKRISGMFLGEILRITLVKLMNDPTVPLFQDDNSASNDYHSTTTVDAQSPLFKKWAVDSSILSIAEADNSLGLRALRQEIEKSLGVSAASLEDAQAVKLIANAIGKRAARLAGSALAAVIIHTERLEQITGKTSNIPSTSDISQNLRKLELGSAASATLKKLAEASGLTINEEDFVDIGVDGSLVEFYPGFEEYMREAIRAIEAIGVIGERRIRIGISKDGSGVGAALIALVAAEMELREGAETGVYGRGFQEMTCAAK